MSSISRASLISQLLLLVPMVMANLFSSGGNEVATTSYEVAPASHSLFSKEDRIIGGDNAEEDRFPYSVSMQDDKGHFCGGSLIGPDVVLTAAHCLGGNIKVAIGSDDVDEGEIIAVKKVVEHPSYNAGTDQYDFGLLFLESSTTLNIAMVKLNSDNSFPEPGSTTYTMGWGDTDPGDSTKLTDQLLITDVEVISNDACAESEQGGDSYKGWIYEDMLCTFTNGQDACQGDSGGPLIVQNGGPGSDVQVGVVSWGVGCAFLPGVFSRVSMAYDWIQTTVCEESADQPGSLCGTDSPTPSPVTPSPTKNPTNNPTRNPTNNPTTSNPTRNPTKNPTLNPTKNPTARPSVSPTTSPSSSPSKSPTLSPTTSPTTSAPTLSPTEQPTLVPSMSSAPTGIPSASPTLSAQPTSHPTDSPSISLSPSEAPSAAPTISLQPTESPSDQPSFKPSSQPSPEPSISPSWSPSTSSSPTLVPSVAPSLLPSNSPTMTTSPSMSSSPTTSPVPTATPTIEKSDRIIPGSSLLIPDVSALSGSEEEASNSSNRIGHSFAIGAFLSSIISMLMVL